MRRISSGHHTFFAAAALVAVLLAAPPAEAISGVTEQFLYWNTTGDPYTGLRYHFQSLNQLRILQHSAAEAPLPMSITGQLKQDGSLWTSCAQASVVANALVTCWITSPWTKFALDCPWAQGIWTNEARGSIINFGPGIILPAISGPVFANCPPEREPRCLTVSSADAVHVVDLDTGLPVPHEVAAGLAPAELHRTASDSHGDFKLEEWALVEVRRNGRLAIERASSGPFTSFLGTTRRPFLDAVSARSAVSRASASRAQTASRTGEAARGRYLVVHGAGHRFRLPAPLVRLTDAPADARAAQQGGRVLLRAVFDHHGALRAVETLEGPEWLGRSLAERLKLEHVEGAEHRVTLFALFDLEWPEPKLLTAIPVLPQCCCGGRFCV